MDLQAEIVRRIRALKGEQMSDAQFAAALRKSAPQTRASKDKVSLWFKGQQEIGVRELQAIADFFGVHVGELLLGKEAYEEAKKRLDDARRRRPSAAEAIETIADELGYDATLRKRKS